MLAFLALSAASLFSPLPSRMAPVARVRPAIRGTTRGTPARLLERRLRRTPTRCNNFDARRTRDSIEIVAANSADANKTELFGDDSALQGLLIPQEPLDDVPSSKLGKVSLVGSGPGDPQLLTVAAYRMISSADLVICDRLVSKDIRNLVTGELKIAKKYPGCADYAQMEIYRWIAQGLREGKDIVRLKIGDPFIFGRGAEEVLEIQRLTRDRVTPRVVPGVSSVFSAPLLGGAALTHRGIANNVILGTGFGKNKSKPAIVPYQEQTTAVFLMAIGRIQGLCTSLMEAGYPELTPLVVIEKASCADQRVLVADLLTAPELVAKYDIKPPSTIVVGEAGRVLFPPEKFDQGLVPLERLPIDTNTLFYEEEPVEI